MLFNLLLANITVLFCFFFLFFRIILKKCFTIYVEIENVRLRLALVTSTSAPIKVANNAMEMLELVADKKKIEIDQKSQNR